MNKGFELNITEEGVFLVVAPDCTASIGEIISALKERGVTNYDGNEVKNAFDNKQGAPVRVADPREDKEEDKDGGEGREADFRIKISEDALTCELWLIPPSGDKAMPTLENVKGFMNTHGAVYGHDEDAIKEMITAPIVKQWVVTAKGNAPENGCDAKINYKTDIDISKPKTVGENVDMKELGAVINVIQGQEIVEKTPLVQGRDGMTVTGKKIPAYVGKDKNMPLGKGLVLSDDKLRLYAEFDGNLITKDGKLSVSQVFDVKGDVDYGIGNIDFIGTVMVHGSVREGFDVRAGGDIVVDGVVEGATLKSEGNLTIKTGIRGTGKATVIAKGDVSVSYIDQAKVRSGGNIAVSEAILHSDIGARGEVVAAGSKKGQIIGGMIQAGSEVTCEVLGSDMGTKTEVIVGDIPELAEEKKRADENLSQLQEQLEKIEANVGFLKSLQQKGPLPGDKQAMLTRMTKAKFQLRAQCDATKKKIGELSDELEKSKSAGCVRVKGTCYPGVTLTVCGVRYIVREKLKFTRFVCKDGEVKIKSFD
ncbi:MAG: FapA family protein [Synergistaceae bacterium]|nr:FapA family protein [Synergistaceae bacterium]